MEPGFRENGLLAIDLGNSTTAFAWFEACRIAQRAHVPTRDLTADRIRAALKTVLHGIPDAARAPVAVACVVPDCLPLLERSLADAGLSDRCVVDPFAHEILPTALERLETVGVDRLLAARAAGEQCADDKPAPRIIIQAGTAVTVDLVDARGIFQGGVILPGPDLWLQALASAARIPLVAAEPSAWCGAGVGRNTPDAIQNGLALGLSGAIERAVEAFVQPEDGRRVFLAGGWARALQPVLRTETALCPDLVLHGLRLVAADRRERKGR